MRTRTQLLVNETQYLFLLTFKAKITFLERDFFINLGHDVLFIATLIH